MRLLRFHLKAHVNPPVESVLCRDVGSKTLSGLTKKPVCALCEQISVFGLATHTTSKCQTRTARVECDAESHLEKRRFNGEVRILIDMTIISYYEKQNDRLPNIGPIVSVPCRL